MRRRKQKAAARELKRVNAIGNTAKLEAENIKLKIRLYELEERLAKLEGETKRENNRNRGGKNEEESNKMRGKYALARQGRKQRDINDKNYARETIRNTKKRSSK